MALTLNMGPLWDLPVLSDDHNRSLTGQQEPQANARRKRVDGVATKT